MGWPERDIAQAKSFIAPPGYSRHRPETTLLYQLVAEHYPKFRDRRAAEGRALPQYVEDEFEAYLKCGLLQHGFLRVKCESCQAEKLVAFSCKRRGFCPSCGARRMAETAALLVDDVLPRQPVRQWVLSLPFALRYLLATRPEVITQASAADCGADRPLARALRSHYTRHRERVSRVRSGRGGADQRPARGVDYLPDRDGAERGAE
jgi:ribosomal protein S27E